MPGVRSAASCRHFCVGAQHAAPQLGVISAFGLFQIVTSLRHRFFTSLLRFQLESCRRQPVQPSPHKPIDEDYDDRHDQRRSQQHIKLPTIARPADRAPQPRRRNDVPLKVKILRNDARVPRAAGCGDHAGEVNKAIPDFFPYESERSKWKTKGIHSCSHERPTSSTVVKCR